MKNLPDKIYLNFGDLTKEEYNELDFKDLSEVTWSEDDVQGMNVEYVRKDVFIKKACEWFRRIDYDDSLPPFETTEEFIEGFKEAMKL